MMLFSFIPALYIFLGITYGTFALVTRLRSYLAFKELSFEAVGEIDRSSRSYNGKTKAQRAGFVFTLIMLIGILGSLLTFIPHLDILFGFIILIFLICPPFIIGFNFSSIWNKDKVRVENAALRERAPAMIRYYAVLIPTWILGILGSFGVIIAYFVIR